MILDFDVNSIININALPRLRSRRLRRPCAHGGHARGALRAPQTGGAARLFGARGCRPATAGARWGANRGSSGGGVYAELLRQREGRGTFYGRATVKRL